MESLPPLRAPIVPLLWSEDEEDGAEKELGLSPSIIHETEGEECITQPVQRALEGVTVYVDVRSGTNKTINTGQSLEECLTALGASIVPKLTKDVTHIIYKDGKTNLDRVDKRDVFLVNPLWLNACKNCNERVSEAKYPVTVDKPGTPVVLGKIKRMKSMQPKPFEEQVARSVERKRKVRKLVQEEEEAITAAVKQSPRVCPFEFNSTDDEQYVEDERDSRDSTPESLPPVNFSKVVQPVTEPSSVTPSKKASPKNSDKNPLKEKNQTSSTPSDKPAKKKYKSTMKVPLKPPSGAVVGSASGRSFKLVNKCVFTDKKKRTICKANDRKPVSPPPPPCDTKADIVKKVHAAKKRTSFEKQKPTLVMTSVSSKDQGVVHVIVNKLGGFELTHTVTDSTSHVICGANRRTVNVLAGTVRGCWMLSIDWVLKSLEAGHWLPEGAFEMITEFPAAQFFRLERQQAGLLYRPSLFHKAGSIFISHATKPSPKDLELLLTLAGAKLTASKLKANVIIGRISGSDIVEWEEKICVSESWVLESITRHSLLPVQDFLISNDTVSTTGSPEL